MNNEEIETKLSVATEALVWGIEMLEARDVMNAKVHCAPVRLSPITLRLISAWELITDEKWVRKP